MATTDTQFTYSLSGSGNDLIVSKIRLEAGDSRLEPWGLRPNGINFSDDELLYFYDEEGDHVGRAACRAVEVAATEWGTVADNMRIGEHWEAGKQAYNLTKRAEDMRVQHGKTPSSRATRIVQYSISRPDST